MKSKRNQTTVHTSSHAGSNSGTVVLNDAPIEDSIQAQSTFDWTTIWAPSNYDYTSNNSEPPFDAWGNGAI